MVCSEGRWRAARDLETLAVPVVLGLQDRAEMAPSLPRAPSASPAGASRPPEVRPTPPRPSACTLSSAAKSSPFYAYLLESSALANRPGFSGEHRLLTNTSRLRRHLVRSGKVQVADMQPALFASSNTDHTPPSHGGNTGSNPVGDGEF